MAIKSIPSMVLRSFSLTKQGLHRLLVCLLSLLISIFTFNPTTAATIARSVPVNCEAMTQKNNAFNQHFLEFMDKWQTPGASIAVMKDNKLILSCGYGWANLEEREPVLPNSLFRLGSISKTITAIAILKLIEEKKLCLEDKVFNLLSSLKPLNDSKINPDIHKITIRNLLQMSSGWYTDRPEDYEPMFGPWSNQMLQAVNYQVPTSCETAARLMMSMPLQFTPGTKFSYSNLNYCLLGLVITKFSEQQDATGYENFIKQKLLLPLNITDMQIGFTLPERKAKNEVKYYAEEKNLVNDIDRVLDGFPYGNTDILKKNYADGGWIASSPDLVKILQALHSGRILNRETKNIMIEKPTYADNKSKHPAIGWDEVNIMNGKIHISKTGSFTGTKAFILQKNDGISYAVLFNTKPPHGNEFIKELTTLLALIAV